MFSISTRTQCRLCSLLSYRLKELIGLILGKINCRAIATASGSSEPSRRVSEFNEAAPDCQCEKQRTSKYSPRPVGDSETLTRFIFSPLHVRKNGDLKPSLFSHVESSGCSVQREEFATNDELTPWVSEFLQKQSKQSWFGTVSASSSAIRNVEVGKSLNRAFAVYDTAEKINPAHAEVFQTQYVIDEADRIELRAEIMKVFGGGVISTPEKYREGVIWNRLTSTAL